MKLENNIKYNNLFYRSGPVSVMDVASGKLQSIQTQLFELALMDFCKERNVSYADFKNQNIIIERKATDYFMPSEIVYKSKSYPFMSERVDLAHYWSKYFYKNEDLIDDILMMKRDGAGYVENEIVNVDYVRNEATVFNRYLNIKFYVPLSKITNNTNFSYWLDLNDKFINLSKNI